MIGVPGGTSQSYKMGDRCLFAWLKPLINKQHTGMKGGKASLLFSCYQWQVKRASST